MKKLLISLAAAFVLAGCAGQAPVSQQKTVYKIGFIGPLSGDTAAYGIETQRVVSYALDRINAEAKGYRFEMVYEDGKCAGNASTAAFQKLTDVDGIRIILGGLCSSETLAAAPLAGEKKVLLVSGTSSNPDIETLNPFVFTFSYSDDSTAKGLAEAMKDYKKVAIITEQNDFNIGIQKVWREAVQKNSGMEIVADETFPKGSTDFRNLLAKVRQANPDALLLNPNPGSTADNLLRQLGEMADWKIPLFAPYSYLADSSRTVAPQTAENMIIVDAPRLTDPAFLSLMDSIVKEKGTLENLGNFYTASTWDAIHVLTDLTRQFNGDPEAMQKALSSGTFKGVLGTLAFKGNNFVQGIASARFQVKDGKAVPMN